MSEMASGDILGDVFEDRRTNPRVDVDIVRETNRETAERRIQEIREEEEEEESERRRSESSRKSSRRGGAGTPAGGSNTNLSIPSHGDGRPSNESHGNLSLSSSLHRRGFFRRKSSASREQEDLEEGRAQQARVEDEKS